MYGADMYSDGARTYFTYGDLASFGDARGSLWVSDGSAEGTQEIATNLFAGVHYSSTLDGVTYFAGKSPATGHELWKTDGTAAGTVMVADILPGSAGSNPTFFFGSTALGLMFFQADGGQGSELWATDGTAAGTRLVKDINPSTGSFPALFVGYGGAVYFAATSDLGRQLWRTDGTAAGTFPVDPVSPGMVNIFPDQIMSVGGVLLYVASDGVSGYELWRSDGTAEGTYVLKDISPGMRQHLRPAPRFLCRR